ncbi:MAG: recombinase family protein [Dysosmobacter sp.]
MERDILTQLISDLYAARTGSLLWSENIVEINKQISDIASQERLLAQLKQQECVDPDIFISRSNQLAERLRELKLQKERILRSEEDHTIQQTQDLLDVLESGPDWLDDFDEQLFSDMIEKIVVVDNETLRFRLLNGLEVTEKIERTPEIMGKRKQPFGYKMKLGEIVPQPQEAETVRSIYLQYLAGVSFKQLAERLQTEDVPYDDGQALEQKYGSTDFRG